MDWSPLIMLLPAAAFAGLVAYGLSTGRMPAGKASPVSKAEDPVLFWILAGVWMAAGLGCLIWIVAKLLGS